MIKLWNVKELPKEIEITVCNWNYEIRFEIKEKGYKDSLKFNNGFDFNEYVRELEDNKIKFIYE